MQHAGPLSPQVGGKPPHQRWTQSDITALRTSAQTGMPLTDLVRALGREPEDVSRMVARLGLLPSALVASGRVRSDGVERRER